MVQFDNEVLVAITEPSAVAPNPKSQLSNDFDSADSFVYLKLTLGSAAAALGSVSNVSVSQKTNKRSTNSH
jgi:hypothetical protein